jgi:hypothetical protein
MAGGLRFAAAGLGRTRLSWLRAFPFKILRRRANPNRGSALGPGEPVTVAGLWRLLFNERGVE